MNKPNTLTDSTQKICPHCQKEIVKGAKKCPECHSDLRPWPLRHPVLSGIGALILLSIFISAIGGSGGSTSTSAPDYAKPAPVEVVSITTKVTESNSVWSKYAWNLTLKNNTDKDRTVRADVEWTDKEGFVVDTDVEYSIVVPANSETTFNDFQLIDASVAGDVENIEVEIR